MKLTDVISRLAEDTLVTIADEKGDILVHCTFSERIKAFEEFDEELHHLLRSSNVYGIEIGKVYKDLILSVVVEKRKETE